MYRYVGPDLGPNCFCAKVGYQQKTKIIDAFEGELFKGFIINYPSCF